jgi:hypothetical protein
LGTDLNPSPVSYIANKKIMSAAPETVSGPLITADGIPLKESLQKSLRRSKIRAALLVAPPLLFLIFLFVIPIGNMLTRSVDDKLINQVLPNTFEAFESWDKVSEPDESMFEAIYQDLKAADKTDIGKASVRMNYAKPGWRSLIKRTARRIKKMEPPYKEAFLKADDRWTDNEYWLCDPCRRGTQGLQPAMVAYDPGQYHRNACLPAAGLPGCLPAGDAADAHCEPANDLCTDAVLDLAAGAHRRVDDHAAAKRRGQRHAGGGGDTQRRKPPGDDV